MYRNDLDIDYQICNIRGLVCDSVPTSVARILKRSFLHCGCKDEYRGADKSLARPGKKLAAPVKSVMGGGMD